MNKLHHIIIAILTAFYGTVLASEKAQADRYIVVSAPLSGSLEIIGRQIEAGAKLASDKLAQTEEFSDLKILSVDDKCSTNGANAASSYIDEQLKEEDTLLAVIGLLCVESAEVWHQSKRAITPLLISLNVQDGESLASQRAAINFTYAPNIEIKSASKIISDNWSEKKIAIIDDGSSYGSKLAEGVHKNIASSSVTWLKLREETNEDDITPLIIKLNALEVSAIFIAGQSKFVSDLLSKIDLQDKEIMTGEAAYFEPYSRLPAGLIAIAPKPFEAIEASKPAQQILKDAGLSGQGFELLSFASMQLLPELVKENGMTFPAGRTFSSILGEITFDENGQLLSLPYQEFEFDGKKFKPKK